MEFDKLELAKRRKQKLIRKKKDTEKHKKHKKSRYKKSILPKKLKNEEFILDELGDFYKVS